MDILHSGFDKLEVSFSGAVPRSVRVALNEAKERAIATGIPEFIDLRGVQCWVKDKGASGGYEFVIDTGADGEMWAFKNSDDPTEWNFRAVVSSARCAMDGWEGVRDRLRGQLDAWGVKRPKEQREAALARIDYAVDFISDGFSIDPARMVCHSRATVAEHESTSLDVHWKNREVSSVTVGKMPGRQVIVYDKTREIAATGKREQWLAVWGFCPMKGARVWRVEVRAGKDHLTRSGIRTFEDAEASLGTLFREAMEKIRLVVSADVGNITRALTVPEWRLCTAAVAVCIAGAHSAVDASRVVEGRRDDLGRVYRQQIIGCMVAYAHTLGRGVGDFIDKMPGEIAQDLQLVFGEDQSSLVDKFRRASARLKFIDDPPSHNDKERGFSDATERGFRLFRAFRGGLDAAECG